MRTTTGALWRKWDLHIHTPASFHWSGAKLHQMSAHDQELTLQKIVEAINTADAAVFAVMDYWTFDGYIALRRHVQSKGAGYLKKRVFPGIELRLVSPTDYRLNVHALFSDELTDQQLSDFRSKLKLEVINMPLSQERLIELGKKLGADKLKNHGFDPKEVHADADVAWSAGSTCAEIDPNSFLQAFEVIPQDMGLVFMPWDTSDGLSELKWAEHYAYARKYFSRPEVFETRDFDYRCAFVGVETPKNKKYIEAFQKALDNKPRLAICGSDAHSLSQYGVFPGAQAAWIKAEPSFLGLLQAIKEPEQRSWIGEKPPKLEIVESHKTQFFSSISVKKHAGQLPGEDWFDATELSINHDLVAIIGNKGSGKSALADIIALLGDAQNSAFFSFLNAERFRSEPGSRAKHFTGRIVWQSKELRSLTLDVNPAAQAVQRIKYIPQKFFEELCNEHVSKKSDRFERELRDVIFSHIDPVDRLDQTSFDALLALREKELVESQRGVRTELEKINEQIERIENRLYPSVRSGLEARLSQKENELKEHEKLKPSEAPAPTGVLTPEQQAAVAELSTLDASLVELTADFESATNDRRHQAGSLAAIERVRERLKQVQRYVDAAATDLKEELTLLGLTIEQVLNVEMVLQPLDEAQKNAADKKKTSEEALDVKRPGSIAFKIDAARKRKTELRGFLDEPNKKYQEYRERLRRWEIARSKLLGDNTAPETIAALKAEIERLDALPARRMELQKQREDLSKEVYGLVVKQRNLREELFRPVQELIEKNPLIRDDYRLQFQSFIAMMNFEAEFFDLIRQNSGSFRGDEEGRELLAQMLQKHDVTSEVGLFAFLNEVLHALENDVRTPGAPPVDLGKIVTVGNTRKDLYDFIFSLEFLVPRYSLLFQDTPIEKLSPGQRGALLLIFYLLVDRDGGPIVLDQPEENLDNETVVTLLVPVVKEAKRRRQIVMVTHNPNLAVVCDAEQIIHAQFSRTGSHAITYTAGPIEDPEINKLVVDVLEGTKRAFDNRGSKYHK